MTGFIHKCELLDICSCEFGQADRQRNKPKYGCLESHILPTACLHLMWGCADISFVVKQKSNTEIQRSGWNMNDKLFKPLRKKVYAVHKYENFAFWKTYVASKFDKKVMHVFQNAKFSFFVDGVDCFANLLYLQTTFFLFSFLPHFVHCLWKFNLWPNFWKQIWNSNCLEDV